MHYGVVATAEGRMKQEQKEHLLNLNKWHEVFTITGTYFLLYIQQNGRE